MKTAPNLFGVVFICQKYFIMGLALLQLADLNFTTKTVRHNLAFWSVFVMGIFWVLGKIAILL